MDQYKRLLDIIAALRAPDGCPWDREQTHSSLKAACIEEAAEVVAGINIYEETKDHSNLLEELGDLLLQVVMHAQIASEAGLFDMEDVCRVVSDKMVRRHPHVFADVDVESSDDVLKNWAEIKAKEHENQAISQDVVNKMLFEAFDESKELIDVAAERKQAKLNKK